MKNTTDIKTAIARSISHNEPVTLEVTGQDIATVMADINAAYDGDTDYSDTNEKGQYDVWGCSEEKPDDMEFRLTVVIATWKTATTPKPTPD